MEHEALQSLLVLSTPPWVFAILPARTAAAAAAAAATATAAVHR